MRSVENPRMPADMAKTYFPAACTAAHRPFLAELIGPGGEPLSPRCPECGARARIIPGSQYALEDHARFETMVDLVLNHEVALEDAGSMALFLDGLLRKPDDELRAGLLTVLPPPSSGVALRAARREEMTALVSLLSGVLSLQSEAADSERAADPTK